MRDAMIPDCVQAGIRERNLETGPGGRVAVENRLDVFPHSADHTHAHVPRLDAAMLKLSQRTPGLSTPASNADARHSASAPTSAIAASRYPCAACTQSSQPAPAS